MTVAAWVVVSWSPVYATTAQVMGAIGSMRPTDKYHGCPMAGEPETSGQALWVGYIEEQPFGISWDWAETQPEVIVLADPMTIVTNLILTNHDGIPLGPSDTILHLNCVVHALEWQSHVLASNRLPYPQEASAARERFAPQVPFGRASSFALGRP